MSGKNKNSMTLSEAYAKRGAEILAEKNVPLATVARDEALKQAAQYLEFCGVELQTWLSERHVTLVVSCGFDSEGRHRSQIRLVAAES